MKKRKTNEVQLSLFEATDPVPFKEPTLVDFVRARFEYGPEMDQEEYKRWIKILVNHSLKSID